MEDPHAASEIAVVSFKKRINKSKSNARKREPTPPRASDSESGFTSSEDEDGRQIKRRRKNAGVTATSSSIKPTSLPETNSQSSAAPVVALSNRDDATKASDWYDETSSRTTKASSQAPPSSATMPDGTYKGAANYQSFIQKNPDRTAHHPPASKVIGPVKSSTNVRTITVTDFAPDVCKDYKQTGFCGFGDNCKYLHAREDYKQGWQLDRDWEINTKGKQQVGKTVASANRGSKNAAGDDDDDEKLLDSIPFKCIICKEDYKNPIVTKCGHYFCEACALKRYRKDPSCAACATGTGGVFNVAKKLNRLLERKREREESKTEDADSSK
jgi:RING finger protein 113A